MGETISGRLPQPFRGSGLSQVPAEDAAAGAEERAGRGRRRLWLPLSGMPGPGHCSRGTGAASTEHEVTCSPSFQGVTQRCVGRGRGCPPGSRSVAFVCPPLPDQSPAPGTGCRSPGEQSDHTTADQRGAGLGSRPIKAAPTAPCPFHEGKVTRRVPLPLTAPSFLSPPEQGGVEPELSQGPLEHPHSPSSFRHSGARAGAWPGQGQPGAAAGFYHPAPGVILRARPAPHPPHFRGQPGADLLILA